jgi:multiple sugar transport system ATP-binding protein
VGEIVLEALGKRFPAERGKEAPPALREVSLRIAQGEFVVLVGPSGCGKSTTLRIVAGLEEADTGTVTIGGRSMAGVPPQERDLAMVFQGYALYPQMTVREIMEFPLKMRRVLAPERSARVREAAALLRIDALLDRRPAELSGGERQRVAMGRAIVRKPRVFLFDEPLSNLDAALRGDIRLEIGALVRRLGATAIYVTHDHVEAMTLADRIAVMQKGRVLQFAPPRVIYERPATSFVGTFLGAPRMNLFPGTVDGETVTFGPFRVPRPAGLRLLNGFEVGVRPEDVRVIDGGTDAVVVAVEPLGAETHLVTHSERGDVRIRVQGFDPHGRGARIGLGVDAARVHWFSNEGERLAPP